MAAAVVIVGVGGVGVEDTTVAVVIVGVCGHGERWFLCPGVPLFNMVLCERGPTTTRMAGAPDQGA
jgi:hypothetical protein